MINKRLINTGAAEVPAAFDPYANFETVTYTGNGSTQKITGYIRKGAAFNGTSSQINLGNSAAFSSTTTGELSISLWINTTDTDAGYIVAKGDDVPVKYEHNLYLNTNGTLRATMYNSSSGLAAQVTTTATVNDGNWHHVVLVIDNGTSLTVYVDNGTPVTSTGWSGTVTYQSTVPFLLGAFEGIPASSSKLNGKLDQVRIFNKALSSSEVTTLYGETYASSTKSTTDIFGDGSGVALYQLDSNANDTGGNYNGTATNVNYLGMAFEPSLVWIKNRSTSVSHCLFDSIRGAGTTNQLYSDSISAQGADTTLTNFVSFDTNGFTLGATSGFNVPNYNGDNYVAWCWRGANTTTNVSASGNQVAADIRANTDGGFSIVKYTFSSPSASQTVPHGLNSAPEMIITKCTSTTGDWYVYHKDVGTGKYLVLNSGADVANYANGFATVDATAWQQYFRSDAQTHVAYCFHSINGYQKLGSYTGGGASNVTVSLGFQPRFVLIKSTAASRNWMMYDSLRDTGTVPYDNSALLFADSSSLELTDAIRGIQFTSDGFVLNQNYDNTNGSGETYIYLAIA